MAWTQRRLRAAELGYTQPRPAPGRCFIEIDSAVRDQVLAIATSIEFHAEHCRIAGRASHCATTAATAVRNDVGDARFWRTTGAHKDASKANRCWDSVDRLLACDPWAAAAAATRHKPQVEKSLPVDLSRSWQPSSCAKLPGSAARLAALEWQRFRRATGAHIDANMAKHCWDTVDPLLACDPWAGDAAVSHRPQVEKCMPDDPWRSWQPSSGAKLPGSAARLAALEWHVCLLRELLTKLLLQSESETLGFLQKSSAAESLPKCEPAEFAAEESLVRGSSESSGPLLKSKTAAEEVQPCEYAAVELPKTGSAAVPLQKGESAAVELLLNESMDSTAQLLLKSESAAVAEDTSTLRTVMPAALPLSGDVATFVSQVVGTSSMEGQLSISASPVGGDMATAAIEQDEMITTEVPAAAPTVSQTVAQALAPTVPTTEATPHFFATQVDASTPLTFEQHFDLLMKKLDEREL